MTDYTEQKLAIYRLVLEYIKVFLWPVILILAFAVYGDKLFKIIEQREVDAFGLKLGKQIEDISHNYEAQITQLKEDIEASQAPEQLLKKVDGIKANLDKQLSVVKQHALQTEQVLSPGRKDQVDMYERAGFEALLARDVSQAISQFTAAEALWPDYHNVSEIKRLLIKQQSLLTNQQSKAWQDLFKTILVKHSWGMPDDIRAQFNQISTR
ncbi:MULTISPECIES: hypothetical protein [unclassified Pseudoalteromonas]|uniref:hypothetical protein n=1 Tax=unclassified Pseudoalteromonas TaxID=194690 RepID=UPI002097D709|nr:hypothetical protein [Pseudoalteromonas sp. XMcav2-N]MCO7189618.1 hypothetical protein [Pseudoalteromonas sp. XMcav2-N]